MNFLCQAPLNNLKDMKITKGGKPFRLDFIPEVCLSGLRYAIWPKILLKLEILNLMLAADVAYLDDNNVGIFCDDIFEAVSI